jgi:DTW domain-containing protein
MAAMSDQPATAPPQAATADAEVECPRCGKPPALCVCAGIVPIDNKVMLMILQHPQEQDRELGTARLAALHFKHALLKIGLSWPSLSKILRRPAEPQRWAVLYLGSLRAEALLRDREIVVVNRKGNAVEHQDQALRGIKGIILREPRRDGLSTIEAAAMLLSRLEARPEIEAALTASFERLLTCYREM